MRFRARERERERERERGALLLDNPFSYRASSRLRLDKCSDGCVWGENSRGWLVECWRGCRDMETERKRGRDGSSSLRMCEGGKANEQNCEARNDPKLTKSRPQQSV